MIASLPAIVFAGILFGAGLLVTRSAARQTGTPLQFLSAGNRIGTWQNGFALAGDYLSAAAFLGAAGLFMGQGYDSLVYAVGTMAGWPLLLLLFAEKLRERGRFTMADVLADRFASPGLRMMSAGNTILITLFYLIVQLIGAGKLVELLFGLPYLPAVMLVASLMLACVYAGGMLATTRIQIMKAALLLLCALALGIGVLARHGGSIADLAARVEQLRGAAILQPSHALSSPLEVASLATGLVLGLLGLPHVLMRFFTVPDPRTARISACWATGLIALCFTLNAIIGAGCISLVGSNPAFLDAGGKLAGGGNMAAIHLAFELGGPWFEGLLAAVAFATILAVVSGLTLAGAGAIGHDLYAQVLRRGQATPAGEVRITRLAAALLTLLAVLLSTLFQQQNIAFLFGLAFALAASSHFPVLLLTLFWSGFTARGALATGLTGMLAAAGMIFFGPAVWVGVLGHAAPLFPLANPALFSVTAALLAGVVASVLESRA